MADLELVEKLRLRANVTYDEAKEALDICDDDLLEAVIYLERKGKVPPPSGGGSYSSKDSPSGEPAFTVYHSNAKGKTESFSHVMKRFFNWLGEMLKKSLVNMFEVYKDTQLVFTVPVLVLVLLMCFCFYVTIPMMIVGLFFGFRYRFRGPADPVNINNIMEEVANVTENLKNEMKGTNFKE